MDELLFDCLSLTPDFAVSVAFRKCLSLEDIEAREELHAVQSIAQEFSGTKEGS
jgi:hypothetical protein